MKTTHGWDLPLGVLSALLLAACGGDAADAPASLGGEVQTGGTVVIAEVADMSLPTTVLASSVLDGALGGDVMNMSLARGMWQDGQLVFVLADESPMALARSYEVLGADSTSLRFHMRSDVMWSDGTPVTASDVVYTYEILKDPDVASPQQDSGDLIESVVAEDDSTVTFHYTNRYPDMVTDAAIALMPAHVFEGTDPAQIRTHPAFLDPAGGNLPVSGPYMIGEWRKGQSITLVRNPHFQPAGNLDRIVFRIIPEMATRLVELQTGNVDWVTGVTLDQLPNLRAQAPHVRFEREEKRFYDYIAYNPDAHPAFADPEIRRALGHAIDVPAIISALQMDEFAVPAGGPYSPIFSRLYDPEAQAPVPFDLERARQILDGKGWRDADGDGIREKDGRPFRFTMLTNTGNQRRADVSQIVQQQLRQVGVEVELQQRESNTFFGNLEDHEFEAALGGWSVALYPDLTTIWSPDSPFNFVSYDNPEATALFEQALSQLTEEAAAPYWREAASIISRDQPYTFLYFMDQVDAIDERVQGVRVDTYGAYQNTWEWWVQDGAAPQTTSR